MNDRMYRLTMRELPVGERPREKLLAVGAAALSDAELVAILLRTGCRQATALELARALLQDGGIRVLAEATVHDLAQASGMGMAKACALKAAAEIGRRLSSSRAERATIQCPGDVSGILMEEMRYLDREHFRVVMLNTKNQVLGVEPVAVGSLNSAIIHPREIFKWPVRRSAAAVILVHNHPSGDPTPSRDDVEVTYRLVEAGRLLGIEVLDHVIIGDNCFQSLREQRADWPL
jgi:DNA repair protein RadC